MFLLLYMFVILKLKLKRTYYYYYYYTFCALFEVREQCLVFTVLCLNSNTDAVGSKVSYFFILMNCCILSSVPLCYSGRVGQKLTENLEHDTNSECSFSLAVPLEEKKSGNNNNNKNYIIKKPPAIFFFAPLPHSAPFRSIANKIFVYVFCSFSVETRTATATYFLFISSLFVSVFFSLV